MAKQILPVGWRGWHRWLGAVAILPLIFFCVTGSLLNHRNFFGYFETKTVEKGQTAVRDMGPLKDFISFYQDKIGEKENPAVIRIKSDGTVEFLYGAHGQTTYSIDPGNGALTKTVKTANDPWQSLNRLHKAFKTPAAWAWISDVISLALILSIVTGLFIPGALSQCWRTFAVSGAAFAVVVFLFLSL